jgi:hypothetical protein
MLSEPEPAGKARAGEEPRSMGSESGQPTQASGQPTQAHGHQNKSVPGNAECMGSPVEEQLRPAATLHISGS